MLSPTPKKQSNSLQINLFSNSVRDYKLDFCSKKQITIILKGYGTLAAVSVKLSEK